MKYAWKKNFMTKGAGNMAKLGKKMGPKKGGKIGKAGSSAMDSAYKMGKGK